MKYTNKYGLPEAFVRAAQNDPYSKDGADFTTTQLANPPRAEALKELYPDKLEIDVASRQSAILGQATHTILERGARPDIDVIEQRFFTTITVAGVGYRVGGKIDLYQRDDKTLYEYKTCLTAAFTKKKGSGKKPEWIAQASCNAHLMRLNGFEVERVVLVGILVDWRPWRAHEVDCGVKAIELPLWDVQKTEAYMRERVALHAAARKSLPLCTPKETWGGQMCQFYCESAPVCAQYQEMLKTGVFQKRAEGE